VSHRCAGEPDSPGRARSYTYPARQRVSRWDALAVAGSGVLSAIVYPASVQDPFVLPAVAFTMLLSGSLRRSWHPVRRALHVDPANGAPRTIIVKPEPEQPGQRMRRENMLVPVYVSHFQQSVLSRRLGYGPPFVACSMKNGKDNQPLRDYTDAYR
jgi:hypothetical protein